MEKNTVLGEQDERLPIWHLAVDGLLEQVAQGNVVGKQNVAAAMRMLCFELIRYRLVNRLGDMQRYLRMREAPLQLVAQPFEPRLLGGYHCLDPLTREPRGHFVGVTQEGWEMEYWFENLVLSPEVNEKTLDEDTGFLVRRAEGL